MKNSLLRFVFILFLLFAVVAVIIVVSEKQTAAASRYATVSVAKGSDGNTIVVVSHEIALGMRPVMLSNAVADRYPFSLLKTTTTSLKNKPGVSQMVSTFEIKATPDEAFLTAGSFDSGSYVLLME